MDAPQKGRWWIVGAAWSGGAPQASSTPAEAALLPAANQQLLGIKKHYVYA